MFSRERAAFAVHFPWVAKTKFFLLDEQCIDRGHCAERDLALSMIRPAAVYMVKRALKLPVANVRGLIRHELGHIADTSRSRKGSEQRADDIAEFVTGRKISYDEYDVQTTAAGRYPRPLYLHR